jgi:2OG-Fe(II) oxygenase superfamily
MSSPILITDVTHFTDMDIRSSVTMNSELTLDRRCCLNPRLQSSIMSPESVAVSASGIPVELPLDMFRVLMAFANPLTPRQVFQSLDIDSDIGEFGDVITDFVRRGLLKLEEKADEEHALHRHLNPELSAEPGFWEQISRWVQLDHAVVIPDAFPTEFAERVYEDLDRLSGWSVVEGGHEFFHYRTSVAGNLADKTPALAKCERLFSSAATRRFIGGLSGQDCSGDANVGAAWYRPGEYALPHDDSVADARRSVAYVWYLSKHWRQEWGGAFFWCPTGQYLMPKFNTLVIFNVKPSNLHLVCPVASTATSKRLTINGFWSCAQPSPTSSVAHSPDAPVSRPAYGQSSPQASEQRPFIVL